MKTGQLGARGWMRLEAGPGVVAACSCSPDMAGIVIPADKPVVTAEQTHSANMAVVDAYTGTVADTDALITYSGSAVAIRTADCVPIVLNAPDTGAVAAVHAGWRGTLAQILRRVADRLVCDGADVKNMYAAIGPRICGGCYEVSEDLYTLFRDTFGTSVVSTVDGRPHIDLGEANRLSLLQAGVDPSHITISTFCTLCTPGEAFPSYRRNKAAERINTLIYKAP